jgi:hypothetical protein
MSEGQPAVPRVPPTEGVTAQYYELTLRLRFQKGKWRASVLGPFGLVINSDVEYLSQAEAAEGAINLAEENLLKKKDADVRPRLQNIEWSST